MSGSILVVTFDTSTGVRTGKLVDGTLLADYAVLSGKIASGAVTGINIEDFAITSTKIASAYTANIGGGAIANESITSAKLASGAVIGDRIAFGGIWSGMLTSGAVIGNVIANLAIVSTHIGVGVVGDALLKDAGVLSGKLAASVVGGDKVWAYGILSGKIASGGVIGDAISFWGVLSGKIASGTITEQQLTSGISIDIAEMNQDPTYRAKQLISAAYCVYVAAVSGNYIDIALAISGYMPAIGITNQNILSGQLGVIDYAGRAAAPTGIVSGQYRRQIFVGTSGFLTLTPPSASGQCQQIMGTVKDDSSIFLFPEPGYVGIA